jgi:hypothetical protein
VNQGPLWGRLLKKTRGRQSRATVPLRVLAVPWEMLKKSIGGPCRQHLKCISSTVAELGKVTLKSNGDEALGDESPLKSNCDEAFNDDFP